MDTLTELKFKRKSSPNSDASGFNTSTGGPHDAASAAYKTCVSAWLGHTLGLATNALPPYLLKCALPPCQYVIAFSVMRDAG
jgi:hypothetical protein